MSEELTTETETTETSNWTEGLSEEHAGFVETKGWSGPADILDSYRNLEKLTGNPDQNVKIPGEDDADGWSELHKKLGRPDEASKYKLGIEAPTELDAQFQSSFSEKAFELGLSQKQAEALANWYQGTSEELIGSQNAQRQETSQVQLKELQAEWGNAYDQNVSQAKQAVRTLGIQAEELTQIENAIGTLRMMKLFHSVGAKTAEGELVGAGDNVNGFGVSPAGAKSRIEALMGDKEFMAAYLDNRNPGHGAAVNRMFDLNKIASGEA